MDFLKLLFTVLGMVAPPPLSSTNKVVYVYHLKISILLGVLTMGYFFAVLLSFGILPFFSGFASAEDVKKQEVNWKTVQAEILDSKLFDTRGRQCAAMLNKNQAALKSESERLQEQLTVYYRVAKKDYRLPGCEEY